jgi:hypothetical protein
MFAHLNPEDWIHVGRSYLVSPETEKLSDTPDVVDFLCNSRYRALIAGGEGVVERPLKDDHAPVTFLSLQLVLSIDIDELGIDFLKAEAHERKRSRTEWTADEVSECANTRQRLDRQLRGLIDDRESAYRPNIVLPLGDFASVTFPIVPFSELHFLNWIVLLMETNSILTPAAPNHRCNITKMMHKILPLVQAAKRQRERSFHFVGSSLVVAFLFHLLNLLALLNEHMKSLKFVDLHATFALLKGMRADKTAIFPRSMHHFFSQIERGAGLCYNFCEVRNLAIAVRCNHGAFAFSQALEFLDKPEPVSDLVFLDALSRSFPGQKVHCVRFLFDDGFLSAHAFKPDPAPGLSVPSVFPLYPVFAFQPRPAVLHAASDKGDGALRAGDFTFDMGVRLYDMGEGVDALGLNFAAGTTASLISLAEDFT